MKQGFFTALGTPFEKDGTFCSKGFAKQVEDQIKSGASGLLVMGSMGQEPFITNKEYPKVAQCAVETAKGQCPLLIGVTDTSIGRVLDRIDQLGNMKIDGVVTTAPYYSTATQSQIINFYQGIAKLSKYPVYLYDLLPVAGVSISPATIKTLWKNKNIRGIKTGNLVTARTLMRDEEKPVDFEVIFSNIDEFDIAYSYGINKNLDGMLSCTPKLTSKLFENLKNNSLDKAADYLERILHLRDVFIQAGTLFCAYSYAMNLKGYEGNFAPDYMGIQKEETKDLIKSSMKEIGEL